MYLKGRNGYFFKSFCQILNYRNLKMCDVRLNDNIKRTSGINLEGPSLIRRSRKVWAPPKKWSNCANDVVQIKYICLDDAYTEFVLQSLQKVSRNWFSNRGITSQSFDTRNGKFKLCFIQY